MTMHYLTAAAVSLGFIFNFNIQAHAVSSPLKKEDQRDAQYLSVDPLLIVQASEVWRFITAPDNRIWKDWDASKTPILFYLPDKQDVLINHPAPPEGFSLYQGGVQFPGAQINLKNGETLIGYDGQNTSIDIGGVQSLVVADTLSNRKNNVAGMIFDPRTATEKINDITYDQLGSDPFDTMGMIAHEGFHVFQHSKAANKAGNEMALKIYPTLSVKNNVGFALEGRSLLKAMQAVSISEAKKAAIEWLAIRLDRRKSLSAETSAYEDGTEFNEGLAKYIEYRLTEVLEGEKPGEMMEWIQGFNGYSDLSGQRMRLQNTMLRHMRGEINVNNDPYGVAPLRMRFYYSGMAIAVMLDRLKIDWQGAILEPETTLTSLINDALTVSETDLLKALAVATEREGYEDLVAQKTALQETGQDRAVEMANNILGGANTLLVIDYSLLKSPDIAMGFSPFGIVRVDDDRTIFGQSPFSARLRKETVFWQNSVSPVIQNEAKRYFSFQLTEKITRDALLEKIDGHSLGKVNVIAVLDLPGVKINVGRANISWQDGKIVIQLVPVESKKSN